KQNKKFKISGNALVSKSGKTIYVMPSGRKVKNYRVSGKVTKIAKFAFWGSDVQKVTLGKKVSSIGDGAFAYTTLKEVKFGNKLEKIGYSAFEKCGLSELKLPNSLATIKAYAFCSCPLTEVVLPAKVSKVGYMAFGKNRKMQKIVIKGNTNIEEEAFFNTTFYKDSNKNIVNQPITVVLGKKMKAPIKNLCDDLGSLIQFQVDPGNTKYYVKEGDLYTIRGDMLVYQMGKDVE
ncbi:MAG: leucine-rich repeat domain-containing protein, partial [Lachnospiraceae bacterium]|nr:leucine-rich repeat domain-containing protein [Lachnospiraceae bacterium]